MSSFETKFRELPSEDQTKVIETLAGMLRRRGNPSRVQQHKNIMRELSIKNGLEEIANVFLKNGHEIEVLT